MLMKSEKKSKNRKKNVVTDDSEVTKGDVKDVDHDSCFKEESLSFTGIRKERDKTKMETQAPGESEDSYIKIKKERGGGKQHGKYSKDGCEDTVENVFKKKKKLKNEQDILMMHDASLDTKTLAHESASRTHETKAVETLGEGSGGNLTDEVKRKKKKKKKDKRGKDGQVDIVVGVIQGVVSADEVNRKKRKKDKKKREDGLVDVVASVIQGDVLAIDEMKRKKRKKDKRNKEDGQVDIATGVIQGDVSAINEMKRKKRKKDKNKKDGQVDSVAGVIQGDVSAIEETEDRQIDDANIRKMKKTKLGHNSKNLTNEKTEKRVRFSDNVQFFHPISDPSNERHENNKQELLLGKYFTQEEDEIVKDAVCRYIEVYNLGDEGLQKVLNSKSYPKLRGCWKEIGKAIPYRPFTAVYHRAQRLFRMGEKRKWTEEEYGMLRKFQGAHGNKWTLLANELGKHPDHVGNAWDRIKLENRKRGQWDQEEVQKLFDLVNTDLQLKLSEERKSRHGMLRDNICWSSISDNLSTRISHHCCNKWYRQLTSSMVVAGEWADTDDYRLIAALFELDASCIEDVDWDNLLSHRHGDLCRKRWKEMVRQISQHENKSFDALVEVLAKRYRPDLVGAREVWDSKPLVP
ncbi:uncharacterized protein LOC107028977 [Solanum pennellii]|uniref:Uncharacterized protein LOC107028977 n=1 Tax=Solanum pennellii TaxID=28526 RepID=A0ABM1HHU1_SOLPN|nr:uncharacterized protein LOC107028977 [Solanum pennellii]XP_015085730.1 uncharacterized protein LOC107028977 [Solanum pennellii]XP_015085731.1 uncharacterized protein LOC107028977 [Solanum pennellii]